MRQQNDDFQFIIPISNTQINTFVVLVFLLAYGSFLFLRDIMEEIFFFITAAIVIISIVAAVWKVISNISHHESIIWIVLGLVASIAGGALFLYTTHLFSSDLSSYGDGIWDMISFAVGLFICGIPWAITLYGWVLATFVREGVDLVGLVFEGIGTGILFALIQWAAS